MEATTEFPLRCTNLEPVSVRHLELCTFELESILLARYDRFASGLLATYINVVVVVVVVWERTFHVNSSTGIYLPLDRTHAHLCHGVAWYEGHQTTY